MHKVKVFKFITGLLFCLPFAMQAQVDTKIAYYDHIYRDNIKTVQLHQTSWKFSPPLIEMGAHQKLQLDFDDLNGGNQSYYYTYIHCDANWQPSDLDNSEYLRGFMQDYITDYSYSFNTYQNYTHYTLVFPNRNIQILYSGNYILKVYLNNNPDSLVFTKRFMIYENQVSIHAREKQAIAGDMYTKQEVIFSVNTQTYKIMDPFHAMQVVIMQNGRWDNAIVGLQPQYIQDTCLQFFQDDGNMFDGGNSFRNFDMTSLRYNTEHIEGMIPNNTGMELQLKKDVPRATDPYFYYQDIDGQYMIMDKDADSATINSEYVWVHFFLPSDSIFKNGCLYLFGQLTDWQCRPEFQMRYDDVLGAYTAKVYLKQGYYDYEYAFLPNNGHVADITKIEGNHFDSENTYYILVYNHEPGLYYDKLVGFTSFHGP
jgi:hypothetical protein